MTDTNDISPVFNAAFSIIEKSVEGTTIKIIDEKMRRSSPSEHYPLGQWGLTIEITLEDIGTKKLFILYQLCEDIICPIGHLIAQDVVYPLFKDEFDILREKFNL